MTAEDEPATDLIRSPVSPKGLGPTLPGSQKVRRQLINPRLVERAVTHLRRSQPLFGLQHRLGDSVGEPEMILLVDWLGADVIGPDGSMGVGGRH